MIFSELINKKNITMYRLSSQSGIPYTTINDICSGKTKLEKCSAETIYKLAKTLNVNITGSVTSPLKLTFKATNFEKEITLNYSASQNSIQTVSARSTTKSSTSK